MSRGKYKAKAINRAAAIDNEVIADLRAQVCEMSEQLTAARIDIEQERANRRALAAEIAAADIEAVRKECAAEIRRIKDSNAAIADRIENYWVNRDEGSLDIQLMLDVINPLRGKTTFASPQRITNLPGAGTRKGRRNVHRLLNRWQEDAVDTSKTPSHPDPL